MEILGQWLTLLALLGGTFFSVVGVLGYLRLPDVYTRLHATGKVGVFGVVLLLLGAILWTPLGAGLGGLFIVLLLLAGPVTGHALSSAAYRIGLRPLGSRDDLAQRLNAHAQVEAGPERSS